MMTKGSSVKFISVSLVLFLAVGVPVVTETQAQCPRSCFVPNNEESFEVGEDMVNREYDFEANIWGSADPSYSFNARTVEEYPVMMNGVYGVDNCWFNGSGFDPLPPVNGHWTVGGGQEAGHTNYWGYDEIGFDNSELNEIQYYGPANGVKMPCTLTVYQQMQIELCVSSSFYLYNYANTLTSMVNEKGNDPTAYTCKQEGIQPYNKVCGEVQ
jgi:hypothetical protein